MNSSQAAFEKIHHDVQRVIYRFGWSTLRLIQILAIDAFYECLHDLLLIAPTAGGKTEAWLLPVVSRLLEEQLPSVQTLVIAPLKSLINDQCGRMEKFCGPLHIAVTGWHGDIPQDKKQALLKNPRGILIQTPESLEALLMNHSPRAGKLFKHLQFVIVDEVHALIEEERGMHVRSLLSRLFDLIEKRPRLIGLSATIGDPKAAQVFLNPDNPNDVRVLGL
jgi:ATP-dependent Lhr-like helicase